MAEFPSLDPCRLCLEYIAHTIDIGDLSEKGSFLIKMVHRLFSLEIKTTDDFSTVVCDQCVTRIEDIHTYYLQVTKAQTKLSQMRISPEGFNNAQKYVMNRDDPLQLYNHFEKVHQTKGYLICCNKRLYHRRTIYTHMARHLQPNAFECPICQKSVSLPDNLIVHLQTHLPESEKPHKCDQCERRYSCIAGLSAHKLTHVPLEKRGKFECEICGKVFSLSTSFAGHMNVVHSKTKFLCAECGRSFKSKASLTSHMMTHDTEGKYEMKCLQCGFMCKNKRSLKLHTRRHEARRLFCTKCEYNTHLRARLNIHMKVKHSDTKPFDCSQCDRKFKLYQGLRTHMAQHTGERRYSCKFCPKTFVSSGNYYTHRKRMHSGLYSKKQIPELNGEHIPNAPIESITMETVDLAREQIKIFEANHKKIAKKTCKRLKAK